MTILVYITAGNKSEANKIASVLVEERLAACVNFFPIKSVYRWKGKVTQDNEFLLFCKTTKKKFKELEKRVKEVHSYELPAIVALPLTAGNPEFIDWIKKSTE